MRKGAATRDRILEIAERAVLAKGFTATSIDEVIAEAGITKSGFFYHFRDKSEMAHAMLDRYVSANDKWLEELFLRADDLADDPLQSFLIALKLLAESHMGRPSRHSGRLIASFVYQDRMFDKQMRQRTAETVQKWNEFFRERLDAIAQMYPPRDKVDMSEVAQMVSCVVDGAVIMSRVLDAPEVVPRQVLLLRSYVKLLFGQARAAL